MPEYRVVPATLAHAGELAATMRQADIDELADMGHEPPGRSGDISGRQR